MIFSFHFPTLVGQRADTNPLTALVVLCLRHRKHLEMESQRHFRACFRHEKRKPLQSWSRADAPTRGRWIPKSFALQRSASRCLATKYKISTSSTTNSI